MNECKPDIYWYKSSLLFHIRLHYNRCEDVEEMMSIENDKGKLEQQSTPAVHTKRKGGFHHTESKNGHEAMNKQ